MQRSGSNNPCPSCGRVKDKDCAWNEEVIFCHQGSSCGPDHNLKIGDCIFIDGAPWALVKTDAGFSGKAYVFKPHEDREWSSPSGVNRRELLDRRARRAIAALSLERFFNAFQRAWDLPDLHSMTPEQLQDAIKTIHNAHTIQCELAGSVQTIWREHPDLSQLYRLRFEGCVKAVTWMAKDLADFRCQYLGESSSEAWS